MIEATYTELLAKMKRARTEKSKQAILAEMVKLSEQFPEECAQAFSKALEKTCSAADTVYARQQIHPIEKMVVMSYIAENYFHHSSSWLIQKMRGSIKYGKETYFTKEEIKIFKNALNDMSVKLKNVADSL